MKTEEKLLAKYSDKSDIKIELHKFDKFYRVDIYSRYKKYWTEIFIIDYCFSECSYDIYSVFKYLRSIKKAKVARRWLWRNIKDLFYGDTGYRIKDFVDKSGTVDFEESYIYWEKYLKENNMLVDSVLRYL